MNLYSWFQLIFYIVVLLALAKPLGSFMAKVYQGEHTFLDRVLGPVERFIYRLSGVKARRGYELEDLCHRRDGVQYPRFAGSLRLATTSRLSCRSTRRDLARSHLIPRGIRQSVLRPTPTGRATAAR